MLPLVGVSADEQPGNLENDIFSFLQRVLIGEVSEKNFHVFIVLWFIACAE